jgi:hypothetical protein
MRVLFESALPFDGPIDLNRRHFGFLNEAVRDHDDVPTRKEVRDGRHTRKYTKSLSL